MMAFPFNVVGTKVQMQGIFGEKFQSSRAVARELFKQEGIRGLYRSLVPTLIKVIESISFLI